MTIIFSWPFKDFFPLFSYNSRWWIVCSQFVSLQAIYLFFLVAFEIFSFWHWYVKRSHYYLLPCHYNGDFHFFWPKTWRNLLIWRRTHFLYAKIFPCINTLNIASLLSLNAVSSFILFALYLKFSFIFFHLLIPLWRILHDSPGFLSNSLNLIILLYY